MKELECWSAALESLVNKGFPQEVTLGQTPKISESTNYVIFWGNNPRKGNTQQYGGQYSWSEVNKRGEGEN